MCMVCIEWTKGKMTLQEVDRALAEIIDTTSDDEQLLHAQEVLVKLEEENVG